MATRRRVFHRWETLLLLVAALVLWSAPMASGGEARAVLEPRTERPPGAPFSPYSMDTDFIMPPSVTSNTIGARISPLPLTVFCVDIRTGGLLPGCTITVSPAPLFGTGGHSHDGAKPAGCFLKSGETDALCRQPSGQVCAGEIRPIVITRAVTDVTGGGGSFDVTYIAPEPSGVVIVSLTGTDPDGRPLLPGQATIGVRITGLEPLAPGENHLLTGAKPPHPDNHFGTRDFNDSLKTLANRYAAAFPGEKLKYNDMSLVEGGLFDTKLNWRPPHCSHRFGVDVDMALVPATNRDSLRELIRRKGSGIRTIIEEKDPPHWHLRQ